jgi:hypothetical protein
LADWKGILNNGQRTRSAKEASKEKDGSKIANKKFKSGISKYERWFELLRML